MALVIRHIELEDANSFIGEYHRHHKPAVGHRFSIAAMRSDEMVGVAIVGRPVAKTYDKRKVLEVTRLCVKDDSRNACSFLYGACARAGRELGYFRIQTYILEIEPGTSLIAAGWLLLGYSRGGYWKHTDGKPRRKDQPICRKQRWGKEL